jgi:hypothetical protein
MDTRDAWLDQWRRERELAALRAREDEKKREQITRRLEEREELRRAPHSRKACVRKCLVAACATMGEKLDPSGEAGPVVCYGEASKRYERGDRVPFLELERCIVFCPKDEVAR